MNHSHNQQKGSAHAVLFTCIVLALITALAWIFWQNFIYKQPLEKDTSLVSADKKDTSKQTEAPLKDRIKKALKTRDFVSLKPYMSDPIEVVYAATELGGPTTPDKAATLMDYPKGDIGPWNFDLDANTTAKFRHSEFYGKFFPAGALIGESVKGTVVSIVMKDNKIMQVFYAVSADTLQ